MEGWLCVLHLTVRVQRSLCDTLPPRHHVSNSVLVSLSLSARMFTICRWKSINNPWNDVQFVLCDSCLHKFKNELEWRAEWINQEEEEETFVYSLPHWIQPILCLQMLWCVESPQVLIILHDAYVDICSLQHNSWYTNTHLKINFCHNFAFCKPDKLMMENRLLSVIQNRLPRCPDSDQITTVSVCACVCAHLYLLLRQLQKPVFMLTVGYHYSN